MCGRPPSRVPTDRKHDDGSCKASSFFLHMGDVSLPTEGAGGTDGARGSKDAGAFESPRAAEGARASEGAAPVPLRAPGLYGS